jgi:membrane protease YdiL (CAAX protease family)
VSKDDHVDSHPVQHAESEPGATDPHVTDGSTADAAATDVQIASRHSSQDSLSSHGIVHAQPDGVYAVPDPAWTPSMPDRRTLSGEMWLVLWLSIASAAISALLSLIKSLTEGVRLTDQSVTLVGTFVQDRPWLDVLYQIVNIALPLVPVLLVLHLLRRSGEGRYAIGLDLRDWKWDVVKGVALASVIGGIGLAFYLLAYHLGMNVRIAAVSADHRWWTPILLVVSALYNATLEEVIVLAFFVHRARQIGWKPWAQVGGSALARASYHLYQGFGGFLGNLAMGGVFALLYRRWNRVMPFLIAHFLIDAVAFLGYYYLGGHVSWLP